MGARHRPVGRLRALLATLCLALFAPFPRALARPPDWTTARGLSQDDYAPGNTGWNGLSDFFALARGLGIDVELRHEIAWPDLSDATLLVIHPTRELVPAPLLAFVKGGGRLIVADDFGTSTGLLARLGLSRHEGPPSAARLFQENPALPVARPAMEHELTRELAEVVTNHPAWFRGDLSPVLSFGEGEIVCTAMRLGTGTLVLLSDPSMLINNMLEIEGNLAFAANLLRHTVPPGGRLVVVVGDFGQRGAPPGAGASALDETGTGEGAAQRPAPPRGPVQDFLREFGTFLGTIASPDVSEPTIRALAAIGAAAMLVALLFLVSGSSFRGDSRWVQGPPPPPTAFEELVRRHAQSPRAHSGLLAGLLRDELEIRLHRELGLDPRTALDPRASVPAMERRAGQDAARRLSRLIPLLASLPASDRGFTMPRISRKRLARMHADVESIFAALDARQARADKEA